MKNFSLAHWPLLLAFFVPFTVLSAIYAFWGVYPFGNSSLLTVDLGQQYVDFYTYFRQTFFENPESFFYSFEKSIGGDMVGLWAYYLTSPFNLLFLLFPDHQISLAVTLLTLIKISLSGLTFGLLLRKGFAGDGIVLSTFSVSYALMGYVIVNQLNIMWLDGLIFLPLVVLGVERLIHARKGLTYSLFLALILFSNYYIGYMICLFLVCYYVFRMSSVVYPEEWSWRTKGRDVFKTTVLFVWHSLLGAGLAGILLLPTFYSLLGSKASYTSFEFDWQLDYPMAEMLSKFFIGAFNFDQMPSGYPNLFIGSLSLVTFLLYFFNTAFSKKERFTALALSVFFAFSLNLRAFNMVWHAMQYPIWYPYRFSFVVCFFMILIGFRNFSNLRGMTPVGTFISMILTALISIYVYQTEFDFIYPEQVLVTILFTFAIVFLLILKPLKFRWTPLILFVLTVTEMSVNAQIDLSRLSYVRQDSFTLYQVELTHAINALQSSDTGFYRIEKTFQRSKNDSFQLDYPSATHFSSTYEKELPILFGSLGFPEGDGFVAYSNGTLLTDSLFGIKYYLSEPNDLYRFSSENLAEVPYKELQSKVESDSLTSIDTFRELVPTVSAETVEEYKLPVVQTKPDLRAYERVAENEQLIFYKNPYVLPVAFGSHSAILDARVIDDKPIQLQEDILHALTGTSSLREYFVPTEFDTVKLDNVTGTGPNWNQHFQKDKKEKKASVSFILEPKTNDSYYLTMSPNIKKDDVNLFLNGEPFTQYKTYRDQLVLNIASQQEGETLEFTIELEDSSIYWKNSKLYRLDQALFQEAMTHLQTSGLDVQEYTNTSIKGNVTILNNQQVLMTTIPYSEGWDVIIDGRAVQTEKVLDSLLAVPIDKGTHEVEMIYHTPYLQEGAALSIFSFLSLAFTYLYQEKRRTFP